jgi:SAM-dependent methyltransferase
MKEAIKRIPILGDMATWLYRVLRSRSRGPEAFPGSVAYWDRRYAAGGDSGVGSFAQFAEFKADVVNEFVASHQVRTVIEFGCGDGNQLRLARYPAYLGFDVSPTAISRCRNLFRADPAKAFRLMSEYAGDRADLVLSLDVIYHLVEDSIYQRYMSQLFEASARYVIIYASDTDENRGLEGTHVRHRKFTAWIESNAPSWRLKEHLPNRYPYRGDYRQGSFAEFFIYEKA